ncbi:MAG: hypothetical protein R3A10_05140 [Caldilineaceae bacterium]
MQAEPVARHAIDEFFAFPGEPGQAAGHHLRGQLPGPQPPDRPHHRAGRL